MRRVAACLLLFSTICWAQSSTAQIGGRITDLSDAVVPGATVTVSNVDTNVSRRTVSNELGYYSVLALTPGVYRVQVQKEGFRPVLRPDVRLEVAQALQLHFSLEVGMLTEAVTVTASVPQVDTETPVVGMLIDDRRLRDLPLNGRNAVDLARLVPGVNFMESSVTPSFMQHRVFINGGRAEAVSFVLDGGSVNFYHRGHGLGLPNPDALQEFKVITTGVPAEHGRGFAVLSAVTKSGTNALHCSLYDFLRNDALDARSFFASDVPVLRFNQFGGTVGGPIKHNRSFFFGSYQGLRIREDQLQTGAVPPTERERRGDFSAQAAAIRDPLTNQPFPNNQVPSNRIDPVASRLLQEYVPLANRPNGQYVAQLSRPSTADQFLVRVDQVLTDRNRLNVRYYQDFNRSFNNFGAGTPFPRYTPLQNSQRQQTATLEDTHSVTANLLNTFRVTYTRFNFLEANLNRQTLVELGASDFVHAGGPPTAPDIAVSGRFNLSVARDRQRLSDNLDLSENLSWTRGRHQVKWGVDIQANRFLYRDNASTGGNFTFDGTLSRDPFADFLLGRPRRLQQASLLETEQTYRVWGLFVQDAFKAYPRLTVNIGLRYEYFPLWSEEGGRMVSFVPGAQSTFIPSAPRGLVYMNDASFPYRGDRNNFGPRIGLAWDIFGNGRTALRASYGISYNPLTAEMAGGTSNPQPFGIAHTVDLPYALSAPYRGTVNPFPFRFDPNNPKFVLPIAIPKSFDPGLGNGYVQNFSFGIQQQISADTMLDLAYVGNGGRLLPYGAQYNPAIYGPGATAGNVNQRRIFAPNFASIGQLHSGSNSSFNSLQVKVNRRLSRGLTFASTYVFSKAIEDTRSHDTFAGAAGSLQNPADRRADRALGDHDVPHRWVSSYLYELPFFRTSRLAHRVVGGWEFGGMMTVQSGEPFRIQSGRDNSLVGVGQDRPDLVGNPHLPKRTRGESISRWFDPAAFRQNGPGAFGNAGRNILRGPGMFAWDVSLTKTFLIREGHSLQFRGDAFNVLNCPVFSAGQSVNLTSPAIGQITSAGDGRILQFSLKYVF